MEALALNPTALDMLAVASTATGPADPNYHLFKEWCGMSPAEREAALLSIDVEGIIYTNTDSDFQVISITHQPADRDQRKDWYVGQIGTRLSRGAEPVRFDLHEVCGNVVVPMREPHAQALGLEYDDKKIINATTGTLWPEFDLDTDFPGEGELCMTVFPRGFPFGQGAEVPQSFEEHLNLIELEKPMILNGTKVPGLAAAYRALQKNEFHSFYGKPNLYGMAKNKCHNEFVKKAKASTLYDKMMVEEKNVTNQSANGVQHSIQYVNKLNQSLCYAKIVSPTGYAKALELVTPAKSAKRSKVKFREQHEDDLSDESDDDCTHPRKRRKPKEGLCIAYFGRFFTFFLGAEINANDGNLLQWLPRDVMHPLFKKMKANVLLSELQGIRTKWDKSLRETRSDIYLQVPDKSMIWSHIMLKKLQAADFSTEAAGDERPSQICLGVFTPLTADQRDSIERAVFEVEMDGQLDQPVHERVAINKNLRICYKINTIHSAAKTIASLLGFVTNLADWNPARTPNCGNKPKLIWFLEQVLLQLASTQGRNWTFKFKHKKHIGMLILVKIQLILSKLASAAGDPDVKTWNFEEGPMAHDDNSDLQAAFHLMSFFIQDLSRALITQEIHTFQEVPELYKRLYPAAPTTGGRVADKTQRDSIDTSNQPGGGAGGGSGGSNKKDLWNSRASAGDAHNKNNDNPHIDKGIFICDKLPYFQSEKNPEGQPKPPKVTVGGKEVIICMKSSSKGIMCTNRRCKFEHIFVLDKIEKGVSELNTWILPTAGIKWRSKDVAAAAAKAKSTVKTEDTGKDDS